MTRNSLQITSPSKNVPTKRLPFPNRLLTGFPLIFCSLIAMSACGGNATSINSGKMDITFNQNIDGWTANFADYSVGMEDSIAFNANIETLPAPLQPQLALKLQSQNTSDDVWMWVHKKVAGLKPNATYRVKISIDFASNAGTGCAGIGGAPGEGVTFKAGAVSVEPQKIFKDNLNNFLTVNFDKGNQQTDGPTVKNIGDLTTNSDICNNGPFMQKQLNSPASGTLVKTDSNGNLWMVIGTDSGFEGVTTYYLMYGQVTWELV